MLCNRFSPNIGLVLLGLAAGITALPAFAQTTFAPAVKTNSQIVSPTPQTAADFYGEGTRLLTRGKFFAQAVSDLEQAVKKEPENSGYVLALGAAYTSRAAVLARAVLATKKYEADTVRYKAGKAKWLAAQKDPKSPAYGYPKLEPIAPPRTQDDNRLFKMEIADAEAKVRQLSLQAWQAADKAVALRQEDTAERRAEARNTQGWCRILLYVDVRYTVKESWPPDMKTRSEDSGGVQKAVSPAETRETIAKMIFTPLQDAADLQPDNVFYLRSLGDAYVTMGTHEHSKNPAFRTKGTDILDKALEKSPDDALLRLRIGSLRGLRSLLGGNTSGPQSVVDVMKQVVQNDKNNAFMWYSLFAAAGDAQDYDTAMDALGKASSCSSFRTARYHVTTPKTLTWAFPPLAINLRWQLVQALHFVDGRIFAEKDHPTTDAASFEHEILVMVHRQKTALSSIDLMPEERVLLEKNLLWASTYVAAGARLLKDAFPQSAEDKQFFAEAQDYLAGLDAKSDAEQAIGMRR